MDAPILAFAIWPVNVRGWDFSSSPPIFAASSDLLTTSFTTPWRGWCPLLKQQLRPWVPRSSTSAPQWMHRWGRQRGKLKRRPTAILTTLLSSRRPKEATGRALSHALDSLVATDSRQARVLGSQEAYKRVSWRASIPGASQARWRREAGVGGGWLYPCSRWFWHWLCKGW